MHRQTARRLVKSSPLSRQVVAFSPQRFASSSLRTTCSSCNDSLSNTSTTLAKCPSCSALLPPPPADGPPSHFELFDLPKSFNVDPPDLKRRFLRWQQQVHPDTARATGGDGVDRQAAWARDWSGRVNTAFKALSDPLPRAEYLLSLEGAEVQEAEQADDPELLMAVLETREALEEAETEDDVASIRAENKVALNETIDALALAFSDSPAKIQEAKRLSIKLRYLQNIEDVCREWAPGKEILLHH